MTVPENALVNEIIGWIRDRGGWAWKVHGSVFQEAGQPDIDGVLDGLPLKIEVKLPGQEPSALQLKQLRRWRLAGACAFWTDDPAEAFATIERELGRGRAGAYERIAETLREELRRRYGWCWAVPPDGVSRARCWLELGHAGGCSWTLEDV